jgi:outer membrane protein OmpA-like peptidoglycan-associated protein
VKVSGRNVEIGGRATTADEYQTINAMAAAELPSDLHLTAVNVVPPVIENFGFAAAFDGDVVVLTGHVPDEASRRVIDDLAAARFAGATVSDRLALASGAPDHWRTIIEGGLARLSDLARGSLSIEAQAVSVRGVAPTKEAAAALRDWGSKLPKPFVMKSFEVSVNHEAAPNKAEDAGVVAALPSPFTWRAERRPGVLTLSGDVPSEDARNQLLAAVRIGYPASSVEDRMVVTPGAPGRWLDAAALGVEQLGRLEEGYVFMSDRALSIVGRLNPGEDVGAFEKSFAQSLPGGFSGSHALAVQRPAEVERAERCQAMIDEVLGEESIAFHRESARVRSTSKPVLAHLAKIAGTCPNSVIEIAARPDVEAEPVDRALARERAQSVLDHLAEHGARNMRLGLASRRGAPSTVSSSDSDEGRYARLRIELNVRAN